MRSYTSKPGTPIPFSLDGESFTTAGSMPLLELSELAKLADADAASAEGAAAIAGFFEAALGKAEYGRFRKHCREHGTDADTLLNIFQDLAGEVGEIPTRRPPPSVSGLTATGSTYKAVSSSGTVTSLPLTPEREAELAEAVARAAG